MNSRTIRSESRYGRGSSNTPCTTLKIAVVAAMPMPSVSTATAEKPGERDNERAA